MKLHTDPFIRNFVYTELKTLYPALPVFVSVSSVEMVARYPLCLPAEFTGNACGYPANFLDTLFALSSKQLKGTKGF